MSSRSYKALLASLLLYVIVSPLSTYNTLALFGLVESRLVPLQLSITAVMIFFGVIAGSWLGKHLLATEQCSNIERRLWTAWFYLIGPPVLFAYYRTRFKKF